MTLSDYQLSIGGLVLGPGTNYIVQSIDGFGTTDVRTTDVPRPRDHGEFYGLDFLSGRTITITAIIRGASAAEVVANIDALLAVWQPVSTDTSTVVPLSYKFPGQDARQFNGRPRRAPIDTHRIIGNNAPIVLEYKVADPRQYDATPDTVTVGVSTVTAGRTYPRTYPLTFGGGSSNSILAVNAGNFSTRPTARILGPATNPSILNSSTGQKVKFAIVLGASDFLDIDFDAKTVVLNGTTSRYGTLTSDSTWWSLAPGSTTVQFSADTSTGGTALTFNWASAWL